MTYSLFTTNAIRKSVFATIDQHIEVEQDALRGSANYTTEQRLAVLELFLDGEANAHTVSQEDNVFLYNAMHMARVKNAIDDVEFAEVQYILDMLMKDGDDIQRDMQEPCDTGMKATAVVAKYLDEHADIFVDEMWQEFAVIMECRAENWQGNNMPDAFDVIDPDEVFGMAGDALNRAIIKEANRLQDIVEEYKVERQVVRDFNIQVEDFDGNAFEAWPSERYFVDVQTDILNDSGFDASKYQDLLRKTYNKLMKIAKKLDDADDYLGHPFASHS